MGDENAALNTDRELFREDTGIAAGAYYENSLHVTTQGTIGMDVGGYVITLPIAEWHALAKDSIAEHPDRAGQADNASTPGVALTEEIAAVLAEHARCYATFWGRRWNFVCGASPIPVTDVRGETEAHRAHVAALIAARIAAHEAGVAARTLRDAADEVDLSGYYDPSPTGGISTSCHLAENAMRDALRDRADRLDAAQAGEQR